MLNALKFNLINALAVQAAIFLLPLMVVGMVALWKNRGVKIAFWMWMGTLAIMTFVFPYSGARGGFIHSGAAVQTVLWAVCPFGLDALLQLGIRKRGWSSRNARIAFSVGVLFFAVVYSVAIFWIRVPGGKLDAPVWTQPSRNYAKVEAFLTSAGIPPREGVIVGDPPGYYLISGRNAVVTPDLGQPNTIHDFATKFHTCILILEADHLESMDDWYRDPGTAGFHYIGNVDTIQVFDVCKAK
jgi:hypothetical protein